MKKTFLIIGGFLIVLIVGIIWIYLFLFGAPENTDEIFAQFGIGNNAPISQGTGGVLPTDTSFTVVEDIRTNSLRQLTTRPIAGMTFVDENTVRYMERGTGYIYDLPLNGGAEQQISYTTHSKVTSAHFSKEGNRVVYEVETSTGRNLSIGAIGKGDSGEGTLSSASLPLGAHDASWSSDGTTVYYLVSTAEGSEARTYHAVEQVEKTLFSIPFSEARPIWGDTVYIYTTPTAFLQGYLYEVSNGKLNFVREGGLGLTALAYEGGIVTTETLEVGPRSFVYKDSVAYQLPLALFPEKCTPSGTDTLLCAAPLEIGDMEYPDDWYKGVVALPDFLWSIDMESREARLLTNPEDETGRMLDISKIIQNEASDSFLLLNKNDMTLWLFTPGL